MNNIIKTPRALPMLAAAIVIGLAGSLLAAEDAAEDLVQMVVNLIGEKDKDLRAMGFQQVREELKGPAATKRFAALLPMLPADAQAGLIDALADRGDKAARAAVVAVLKSPDAPVRTAALRALGSLGEAADVPALAKTLAGAAGPEKTAAQTSLTRLVGQGVSAAIVAELKTSKPEARVELIAILTARGGADAVPSILLAADDADPAVRAAAIAALWKLAEPEHVPELVKRVLTAKKGPDREAVEKAVMFASSRIKDPEKRAEPLLAVLATASEEQKTVLLPTLGRIGGSAALKIVEAAMADRDKARHAAGLRALCNWPDASVAARFLELAKTAPDAAERTMALGALIRVAPLPDKRPEAEKLKLLKTAMAMATTDAERNLILTRARAIRTIESLRFVAPYMNQPAYAQKACETVVELAHQRWLRQPNKAEFDAALDMVIRTSKDAKIIDRAKRYQKDQTAA
ncbi:MAG: HEAT repeat domain-containing protein [Pirellulales bacterium]